MQPPCPERLRQGAGRATPETPKRRPLSLIPRHVIDDIRERTDLVALVERHVKLRRAGNSFVGLCPFHQEKTPSFHVVPHKRLYHCFGCGAGGDAFRFVMELEGLSFGEAVRELAGPAGVEIQERELTPDERRRLKQRASLSEALEAAAGYWESVLMTQPEGQVAREYLRQRGISKDTARAWRLGFAPPGWSTTLDVLQQQRFPVQLLVQAGLAKPRKQGNGHYDTFRDRIIIPITDERGRILGFGARLLEGDGPKYLNSPETDLYRKSKVLFGMQHARQAIQRRDRALVVEGYFDVISLHQAGFPEAVATCGTALTREHLETLRRLTHQVVALFDADEAGGRAAERSLPLFFEAGVEPWRLEVPGAKDPDELVREEGPEAMEAAFAHKESLLDWVIERRLARSGRGGASRDALIEELVGLMSLTEGTELVARVAARLKVPEVVLRERVGRARRSQRGRPTHRDPMSMGHDGPPPPDYAPVDVDDDVPFEELPPPPWKPNRDQVHLMWLLVHRYAETAGIAQAVAHGPWSEAGSAAAVFDRLVEGEQAAAILADVTDDGVRRTLMAVVARQQLYTEDQAPRGMADVLQRLLLPTVEGRLADLAAATRAAVQRGDWNLQAQTTAAQVELRKLRNGLNQALKADELGTWCDLAARIASRSAPPNDDERLSTGFTGG